MRHYLLLIILVFSFSAISSLSSCNKHTCPTYQTSGPTKGVKKQIKKSRAAYSKQDKKAKKKKGKAVKGLDY